MSTHNIPIGFSIPLRIAFTYLLVGGAWILFSDQLAARLIEDPAALTQLQTVKGWFYIVITAAMLFALVRRDLGVVEQSRLSLQQGYDETLQGWARAMDFRDHDTEAHTLRVTDLTVRLALAMGVREPGITHLRRGALLHDIGKISIPDRILLKPGPLTEDEWRIMRQHPVRALDLLAPISYLRPALDIPYCHHERWDGSGYPRSLKGEQIPFAARIFSVVDVWDALTASRPYRHPLQVDQALEYIRSQAGGRFDPRVVGAFLDLIAEGGIEPEQ
jgi:HD-GYP domain-containing protein (c-di-GMP phosphodiesterase class II)